MAGENITPPPPVTASIAASGGYAFVDDTSGTLFATTADADAGYHSVNASAVDQSPVETMMGYSYVDDGA